MVNLVVPKYSLLGSQLNYTLYILNYKSFDLLVPKFDHSFYLKNLVSFEYDEWSNLVPEKLNNIQFEMD